MTLTERIRELDRRYLLADRFYREWWDGCATGPVGLIDHTQAYERWQHARRRYERLRDSCEGLPDDG